MYTFFMGFFSKDKPKDEETLHKIEVLEAELKKTKPIFSGEEYAEWNDAIERFKRTLKAPVVELETKAENEVRFIEDTVGREVKAVEKPIKRAYQETLSMIRIPKDLKDYLRAKRVGKENYAETIRRLINQTNV